MNISDMITQQILQLIEAQGGRAEIQRNELANRIGCVPSQINYVLTSRFSPEQGYVIESRRGGGGYIRITRASYSNANLIMHVINSVGNQIDKNSARIILENLAYQDAISDTAANLILAAISDKSLMAAKVEERDDIRADILKNMLLTIKKVK